MMAVSEGVSLSPKGGGAELAWPFSKSATVIDVFYILYTVSEVVAML